MSGFRHPFFNIIKRILLLVIALGSLSLFAEVLYQRTLTVPENATGCVRVIICAPDTVKGFRVYDSAGSEKLLGLISQDGGRWEFFLNASRGQYTIKYLDEPIKHYSSAPKSGLLHTYRRYDNGVVSSLKDFTEAWKQHPESERRGWETQLFIGCNALGTASNAIHWYRGIIRVPENGDYTFHTCSTDASLLIIDGHQVALQPGKHGVNDGRKGEFQGRLKLRKGDHAIEYWHANSRNDTYAIAAYSLPKATSMTVIPAEWFLQAPIAKLSPLRDAQGHPVDEFTWENAGTLMVSGWRLGEEQLRLVRFSDGTRYVFADEKPFFHKGCTIISRTNYAPFPPDDQAAAELIDTLGLQLMRDGGSQHLHRLFMIGCRLEQRQTIAIGYLECLQKKSQNIKLSPREVLLFYRALIRPARLSKGHYEQLAKELEYLSTNIPNTAHLELARLAFYVNRNTAKCLQELNQCDYAKLLDDESRMKWRILDADKTLFEEGYDAALAKYNAIPSAYQRMDERGKIELEGRILALRNALITGKLDTVEQDVEWAMAIHPACRINAEFSWLKSRILQKQKLPERAAYYAEASLRMQPLSNTRAAARLYLACYEQHRGNNPVALRYINEILKEDGASQEAVTAAKMQRELGDMYQ